MKTTYLVWKNPACNGVDPDWEEITGKAFYALVRSPKAGGRYFIRLENEGMNDDGRIVIEATETEYVKWRKEQHRREYLHRYNPGYTQISYNALASDVGDLYGEELLRDADCDVEAECFNSFEREAIRAAVARLSAEEYRLIVYLYLSDHPGTERGYSELYGFPQTTVNRRKNAALAKLKKISFGISGSNGC